MERLAGLISPPMPMSTPVDVGDLGIVPANDGRSMPSEFLSDSVV